MGFFSRLSLLLSEAVSCRAVCSVVLVSSIHQTAQVTAVVDLTARALCGCNRTDAEGKDDISANRPWASW